MPVVLSDSSSGSGNGNVIVNVTIPTTAINRKLIAVVDQYVTSGSPFSPRVYYQTTSTMYYLITASQYDAVDEYTHLISVYYYDAPAVGNIQTIVSAGHTGFVKVQVYALENASSGVPDYQIETGEAIIDSIDATYGDMVICGAVADPPLGYTIYQYLDTVLLTAGGIGDSDFAFGYQSLPEDNTTYGFQWVMA